MHYYIILFTIINKIYCLPTPYTTTYTITQTSISNTITKKHLALPHIESATEGIISSCVAVGCIILFVIWVFSVKSPRNIVHTQT